MRGKDFDFCLKFIIIGDSGCGKSCLMKQFLDDEFPEQQQHTIGVEFGSKVIEAGDYKRIKLQLWDTCGLEEYRSVCSSYYRNAVGAILTYDITNSESFRNVAKWMQEAKELAGQDIICILVGNKKDLESERQVPFLKASEFAQQNGISFYETSARTGYHVSEVFSVLTKSILVKTTHDKNTELKELKDRIRESTQSEMVKLQAATEATSSWCCR